MNGFGITHRDISPGNVLVRDSDDEDPDFPKCRIIDFDASSLVIPGAEGTQRPLQSYWKMAGVSKIAPITVSLTPSRTDTIKIDDLYQATPSCVAYAVAQAGHSTEYCFHPRQDCESSIYLLLEIFNCLLLDRPLYKAIAAKNTPSPGPTPTASSAESTQPPAIWFNRTRSSSKQAATSAESARSPSASPTDPPVSSIASLELNNTTAPSLSGSHHIPPSRMSHELQVPNSADTTETFQSSRQPMLSHREDNLKKFKDILDALVALSKLKTRPKSYAIVIKFVRQLQKSRILPGSREQFYWQGLASGLEPESEDRAICRGEDENWLYALRDVIQLLKDTLKELRACGESLDHWHDWGEQASARFLKWTHEPLLQMLSSMTALQKGKDEVSSHSLVSR